MAYRTHIRLIDDDSLLRIFSCYRFEDEDDWHHRHTWWRLAHVCRRWRYLIYHSPYHLGMSLILTNDSPSIDTLSHLPPLPLVIDYSDRTRTLERKDEDNICLGLQWNDRVRQVAIQAPSPSLHILLEPMNNPFPRLGDLSLFSTTTEEMGLVLPEAFQAPFLNRLSLHGIGPPKGLSSLSSMIALSTISLTHIQHSCYFTPWHLIIQLQGLPHLEELSIGFAVPIPLPSSERELLPTPIPPVTLPALRRLTFRGVSVYLDNLVAQINTPLLERLSLTLLFELAFTLINLTEYIPRTKGFGCLVARVIFNKAAASIDAGYDEQLGVEKSGFHVNVDCKPLDWQIDSAMQIVSVIRKVLSTIEELTLDLDVNGIPLDWENTLDSVMWHELLLPFIRAKKLHIGSSLALELSRALELVAEGLVPELLPELQELDVTLENDHAKKAFSRFIETRESTGRPVHLWTPGFSSMLKNGYVSQTFGPNSAEEYFHYLLKTNQSDLNQSCRAVLKPDGSGVLFAVRTIPDNIHPTPSMQDHNGRPLWLLDHSIVQTGIVIPQARWSPENANDHRQHVAEAILQMPIFFLQQDGTLGLSLDDAIRGRYQTLRDSRVQAQLGGKTTTHVRIGVCARRRVVV